MPNMNKTPVCRKDEIQRRYGACLHYGGNEVYLASFYKSERSARNAAIRARARLVAAGIKVDRIRTCTMAIAVVGWSSPIKEGEYPSDYNLYRDGSLKECF